jgi:hypothetical protein
MLPGRAGLPRSGLNGRQRYGRNPPVLGRRPLMSDKRDGDSEGDRGGARASGRAGALARRPSIPISRSFQRQGTMPLITTKRAGQAMGGAPTSRPCLARNAWPSGQPSN